MFTIKLNCLFKCFSKISTQLQSLKNNKYLAKVVIWLETKNLRNKRIRSTFTLLDYYYFFIIEKFYKSNRSLCFAK